MEEAELALRWDAYLASWTLAGDAEEYRLSEERRSVLEALGAAGGGMSPKELAGALDKSVGSVKVLLGEMVKAAQVSNPSYGKYALPNNVPYSAYPANSSNGDDGKSKGSKGYTKGASVDCMHESDGDAGCYPCDPRHPYPSDGSEEEEGSG